MLYATTLDGEPDHTIFFWDFPGNIPVEEVRTYLESVSYRIVFETPYVKWHDRCSIRCIEEGDHDEPDFFLDAKIESGSQVVAVRDKGSYSRRYYLAGSMPSDAGPIEVVDDWSDARFQAVGPNIAGLLFRYWEKHDRLGPGTLEALVKTEWERRATQR